ILSRGQRPTSGLRIGQSGTGRQPRNPLAEWQSAAHRPDTFRADTPHYGRQITAMMDDTPLEDGWDDERDAETPSAEGSLLQNSPFVSLRNIADHRAALPWMARLPRPSGLGWVNRRSFLQPGLRASEMPPRVRYGIFDALANLALTAALDMTFGE